MKNAVFETIPGLSEPSLTSNKILSPLVSGLQGLWDGPELKFHTGKGITFSSVFLGVACDLPER